MDMEDDEPFLLSGSCFKEDPVKPGEGLYLRFEWKWYYWISEASPLADIGVFSDWCRFWNVFNVLTNPTAMPINSKYYLLKSHITPDRKDPHNSGGGAWNVTIPRSSGTMNILWTNLLIMIINGSLDDLDQHICGAEFEFTQYLPRVAIWVENVGDHDIVMRVGHTMKDKILLPLGLDNLRPLFVPHLPENANPLYMIS